MSKKKQNQPTPEPINWLKSYDRLMKAGMLMNPMVLPKIQQAIDLEKANKGAGAIPFKKAAQEVIKDNDDLIADIWKNIQASLMNPINGYCW